MKAYDITQLSA